MARGTEATEIEFPGNSNGPSCWAVWRGLLEIALGSHLLREVREKLIYSMPATRSRDSPSEETKVEAVGKSVPISTREGHLLPSPLRLSNHAPLKTAMCELLVVF